MMPILKISAFLTLPFCFLKGSVFSSGNNFVSKSHIDTLKMKIEIWSDVMCPFCFIGKKNFEKALAQSKLNNKIEIIWKSYQLDPSIAKNNTPDYKHYLGKRKGWSPSQVTEILKQVTQTASAAGLDFHFEKAVVANSFDAHRLSHLALAKGRQNEVEELLFAAHFVEGKDISNIEILQELGVKAGLDKTEIIDMLNGKNFAKEVLSDISEAEKIGISGVPFFVFNRKYAVSGAQAADVFLQTLEKSYAEWLKDNPSVNLEIINGSSCTPDGECK
jgi:predicted DsbA family dithiol-disulfide isomerase